MHIQYTREIAHVHTMYAYVYYTLSMHREMVDMNEDINHHDFRLRLVGCPSVSLVC